MNAVVPRGRAKRSPIITVVLITVLAVVGAVAAGFLLFARWDPLDRPRQLQAEYKIPPEFRQPEIKVTESKCFVPFTCPGRIRNEITASYSSDMDADKLCVVLERSLTESFPEFRVTKRETNLSAPEVVACRIELYNAASSGFVFGVVTRGQVSAAQGKGNIATTFS